MLLESPVVQVEVFERRTGWQVKPQGLCRDDVCIPFAFHGSSIKLVDLARVAHVPLVHDSAAGLWALGPAADAPALASAEMPDLVLPDVHGQPFELSSLRGSKVLLLAWASW